MRPAMLRFWSKAQCLRVARLLQRRSSTGRSDHRTDSGPSRDNEELSQSAGKVLSFEIENSDRAQPAMPRLCLTVLVHRQLESWCSSPKPSQGTPPVSSF